MSQEVLSSADACRSLPATSLSPLECRRCLRAFLVLTVAGLATLGGLNVAVDPFGAFGAPWLPADSRCGETRTARGELLRRFTGETVLLGTSRTRIGYDGRLDCIPGGPACNLGLDGTHIQELVLVVEQVAEHPHIRRIVLSLDLHLFTGEWLPNSDFRCSRFNRQRSEFEHWCDLLWNGRTVEAALRAVRRTLRGDVPQHDELGFAVGAADRFKRTAADVRCRAALTQFFGPQGLLAEAAVPASSWAGLRRIIAVCRERGIELTLIIDPVHALMLEGLHACGDGHVYTRWKTELTRIAEAAGVPLWDFTGYSSYTTEPLPTAALDAPGRWFWEPSHFRKELGDLVLERLFNGPRADPGFGVRLTTSNLPGRIAQTARQRQDWRPRAAGELQLLWEILATQRVEEPLPLQVAEQIDAASSRPRQ
jgi:hypothetical protein